MRLTRLWLGMLALAGVAGAHLLAYTAHTPDPNVRAAFYEMTGHGSPWILGALAFACVVAGCSGLFVVRMRAAQLRGTSDDALSELVVRLAGLQIAGFLLLEGAERLSVGGDALGVVTEPVVLLGVLAQIIIAAIGAFVIRLITIAASYVSARRRRERSASARSFAAATDRHLFSRVACDSRSARGPPNAVLL